MVMQATLLAWGYILLRRSRGRSGLVALMVVSAALVYDTAVVSAGHAIGESNSLRQLNWGRFLVGDICVPLLALPCLELGRSAGVGWARRIPAWPLTAALVLVGILTEMLTLRLHPDPRQGVLRYSADSPALPYAAIAVTVLAIAIGVALWRRDHYRLLLVSSVVTFFVSALPISTFGVAPQSGAEVVFVAGLYATYAWRGRDQAPINGDGEAVRSGSPG